MKIKLFWAPLKYNKRGDVDTILHLPGKKKLSFVLEGRKKMRMKHDAFSKKNICAVIICFSLATKLLSLRATMIENEEGKEATAKGNP